MWNVTEQGISKSLLSTWLHCHRAFRYQVHEELAMKPNIKLLIGTYGHKAIEMMRKTGSFRMPVIKEGLYVKKVIQAILRVTVPSYFDYWSKEEKTLIKSSEEIFDVKCVDLRLRGRVDAGQNVEGEEILMDTKFKGRVDDENILKTIPNNIDGLFYCNALGKKKFIIDVVKFPQLKEGTVPDEEKLAKAITADPAGFFKRFLTTYSIKDIEVFRKELIGYSEDMEHECLYSRNYTSCWHCDYVQYCTLGDKSGLIKQKPFSELED